VKVRFLHKIPKCLKLVVEAILGPSSPSNSLLVFQQHHQIAFVLLLPP
jgi:hypothetical protein